ncbi:hypothetical protein A3H85_01575 [Candidatus Daviesbacteria bacterium RIFCSPLOWO2_02_FULL_40_8]|nr:MAG: hypothetical protein A2780_01880 [Candidatus Daviesbacteria bacterium RIFCSPHIGHO2_01_FULL_41_45]OGE66717.1 MAG: hypothetical protein A3H85_01575 [Candidatus Daviesbacteria bacterium RIFCSPLOWO2_02_FULL_40_8]
MESQNPWDEYLSKYKIPILLSLVGGVLLIGGIISSGILQKTFVKSTQYPSVPSGQVPSLSKIKVDISGAVNNPGVYDLPLDSRVEDVIMAAGGVSEDANSEYLSKSINLAQKVTDGMKIYLPFVGEVGVVGGAGVAGSLKDKAIISLNQSSMTELESLPGVGPSTAQKIIDNRPYSSIEELLIKKSVSKAVYQKIKDQVSI